MWIYLFFEASLMTLKSINSLQMRNIIGQTFKSQIRINVKL